MKRLLLMLLVASASGCATSIARSNGPVSSREGVRVSVISVECEADLRQSRRRPDAFQLALKLRFVNDSARALAVRPEMVRLHGGRDEVVAPTAPDPIARVAAAHTDDVVLGFLTASNCSTRFGIDFTGALRLGPLEMELPLLEITPL